ncbi:hypothetical protein BYT27DRAFT_6865192 [Phlegmacium glaucopus]|nr:hypothetical protein BYT27DRAFT_6865192 [Phlegmacium glaucopus]
MRLKEITNFQQFREVSDHEKAIVYCYLESCPQCREMSPIFQHTANLEIFEKIAFFMVNGAKVDGAKNRMGANSYPHISVFQNGKPIHEIRGVTFELEASQICHAFWSRLTPFDRVKSSRPLTGAWSDWIETCRLT